VSTPSILVLDPLLKFFVVVRSHPLLHCIGVIVEDVGFCKSFSFVFLLAINNKLNMDHFRGDSTFIQILITLATPILELPEKNTSLNQLHTNQWIKIPVRVGKKTRI